MSKATIFSVLTTILGLALCGCHSLAVDHADVKAFSLIPAPALLQRSPGYFTVRQGAALIVHSDNAEALGIARHFDELLQSTRDLHLDVRPLGGAEHDDAIVFVLDPRVLIRGDSGDEGYELTAGSRRITLTARTPSGLFYGSITLWQMLTSNPGSNFPLQVPCVHIEDHPRFAWRGVMLDSARHFQTPDFIKRFIDTMAQHKLNVLHWHLTDDQGWRLEIKRYPRLTEVGAWRTPAMAPNDPATGRPKPYGGFYTQDEVREIVRYAAQRYITIVPEIDMPGHAQAAIASYPQFGVTGAQPPVSHDWGVHTWLYNVDEATFSFVENVLTEVMQLFPGRYIHVGGDEAAKDQWQASTQVQQRMRELGVKDETALQAYFTARVERFLGAHQRKLVGWDEILEGGLPPEATVMSWRGVPGVIDAAKQGHDVVMAPSPTMYFDHLQSNAHDEPPGRTDVISLADVYAFEPVPKELDAAQSAHVLGAQANLWSEYLVTPQQVEHAAFPRIAALAEVLWSPVSQRNWPDFLVRMPAQLERYRKLGIAYADNAFEPRFETRYDRDGNRVEVHLSDQAGFGTIRYALGGEPDASSTAYSTALTLPLPTTMRTATFSGNQRLTEVQTGVFNREVSLRLNSDGLQPCSTALSLRLINNPDAATGSAYRVDIMNPCWIYPHASLSGITRIDVRAAQVPYNFQLWHDTDKVASRPPETANGELRVSLDRCDGQRLASIPLAPLRLADPAIDLSAAISAEGTHDLCFVFTGKAHDPLRVIDWVQLSP